MACPSDSASIAAACSFRSAPTHLTRPGAALLFDGVSLRHARTPRAEGKIERQHQHWQGRLPALAARRGQRGGLRPVPRRGGWPFIWSLSTPLKVAPTVACP